MIVNCSRHIGLVEAHTICDSCGTLFLGRSDYDIIPLECGCVLFRLAAFISQLYAFTS